MDVRKGVEGHGRRLGIHDSRRPDVDDVPSVSASLQFREGRGHTIPLVLLAGPEEVREIDARRPFERQGTLVALVEPVVLARVLSSGRHIEVNVLT